MDEKNVQKTETPKTNVPVAKPKMSIEQASYEQLIASNTAKTLQAELHLTEKQIAKGNLALMSMLDNDVLNKCSKISIMRFAYRVSLFDYANTDAISPVPYENSIMAQPTYKAYIEDMIATGEVDECDCVPIYKGIDYTPKLISGNKVLSMTDIPLKDPFEKLEVLGYYGYVRDKDGKYYTCLMSNEEIDEWAKKYSISQRKFLNGTAKSSIWNDNREKMALKTVIKEVARKFLRFHPFDRLARLIEIDQQVFTETGTKYADNPQVVDAKPLPNGEINNVAQAVKLD